MPIHDRSHCHKPTGVDQFARGSDSSLAGFPLAWSVYQNNEFRIPGQREQSYVFCIPATLTSTLVFEPCLIQNKSDNNEMPIAALPELWVPEHARRKRWSLGNQVVQNACTQKRCSRPCQDRIDHQLSKQHLSWSAVCAIAESKWWGGTGKRLLHVHILLKHQRGVI